MSRTRESARSILTIPAGPSRSRICLVPGGGVVLGTGGAAASIDSTESGGFGLPRTVGWPLTIVEPT